MAAAVAAAAAAVAVAVAVATATRAKGASRKRRGGREGAGEERKWGGGSERGTAGERTAGVFALARASSEGEPRERCYVTIATAPAMASRRECRRRPFLRAPPFIAPLERGLGDRGARRREGSARGARFPYLR
ncbi:hypothetical protein KM043_001495 [Ampulex compressa]|nr:hypothetical protein KM043_001495 [Ampulex compressa]